MRIPRKTLIGVGAAVALAAGGTGVALAVSGGGDDGRDGNDGAPVPAATATKAKDAALKVTRGGTVTDFERDDERGATYEVEIAKPDGSSVDVRLDEAFKLVGQPEVDRRDRGDGDDDRGSDRDDDDRYDRDDDRDDRDDHGDDRDDD
ncbi:PepSY domain-containing protein [Conexibacter woesei]|uniref:Uncharacterized protein n=1 Tax=Conexibacter woesei (strain DSM 14684 / CCUG 47730 / CIP 108061 / JCM 11494 / NBRC 100937 / ID131577) TaxID=469383 RepID=D3F654_CONWI|nr:PepSY domain-containing protein [Conexibacter woesei]ADB48727.1 hypothetical protein Cwoe_0291 [Conexibacter woesei DSM 14684]